MDVRGRWGGRREEKGGGLGGGGVLISCVGVISRP